MDLAWPDASNGSYMFGLNLTVDRVGHMVGEDGGSGKDMAPFFGEIEMSGLR